MYEKLPRLAINWLDQPEMVRRYWDKMATAVDLLMSAGTTPISVTSLPSNPIVLRRLVFDAASPVFNAVVVSGGSSTVPVFYDGTNWRVG